MSLFLAWVDADGIHVFPGNSDTCEFLVFTAAEQIGNAVPVNLGYSLGRCLILMLKQEAEKHR
ncbi:MAG: hypothetical protein H7Y37_02915 [Anaerolineae bacterium]|nr:hypothetical protein [Gloeobacterales cyanobacterium ES-bin-313]